MGKPSPNVEFADLRKIYNSDLTSKGILDDFASRGNSQRITKVEQILTRLRDANIHRWEVIALFRKLEELGHGKFVEGRKGHPSRFIWASNLIDVGKAAQGDTTPIATVSIEAANDSVGDLRTYVFPLRTGCDATFKLPVDLTEKEVDRLGAFLKSLAVPE